jgi:hypothetical protein
MIPGSDSAPADPVVAQVAGDRVVPPPRGRPRPKLVVGVVVLLGVIFAAGVLVSHGPKQAVVTTSLSTTAPASVPNAASKPTAAQRAHAAAARLAAKLPVELESAGVVRVGKSLYVVGGKARHGGKPADTILRMTLPSGRVRVVGRFIEPLTDAGAASRGGVLYLAGGWTGEKVATAVLRWSPGQTATLVTRQGGVCRRAPLRRRWLSTRRLRCRSRLRNRCPRSHGSAATAPAGHEPRVSGRSAGAAVISEAAGQGFEP